MIIYICLYYRLKSKIKNLIPTVDIIKDDLPQSTKNNKETQTLTETIILNETTLNETNFNEETFNETIDQPRFSNEDFAIQKGKPKR